MAVVCIFGIGFPVVFARGHYFMSLFWPSQVSTRTLPAAAASVVDVASQLRASDDLLARQLSG